MSARQNTHKKTSSVSSVSSNLLAEQFERDRKSIIYYCFTKHGLDKEGSPIHQYYTHVRVVEDQVYSNAKPPSNYQSLLTNKKKRILIISFNKQVNQPQVHKARENSDGSIQIGRSWLLKDLKQVINNPDNNEGFVLNMNKTYYWETNSGRERTAFIKTLVKIYMDHFTNHVPELIGWDLGLWYLNENSYKRALSNPISPAPTQQTNKGLSSNPIVNQRVTSTLNDKDISPGFNAVEPPYYNENKNHRRSPSVQGKPQVESISEDNSEDLEKPKSLHSETRSTSRSSPVMPAKTMKENLNESPVIENTNQPSFAPVTPVFRQSTGHDVSPLDSAENLMNFYEDDTTSQQLEFIEGMNYTEKGINSPVRQKSPLGQSFTPEEMGKSLENELMKLNEVPLSQTHTTVKSLNVVDEPTLEDIDIGEGVNFDAQPIDFEDVYESPSKKRMSRNEVETVEEIDDETLVQIMDAIDWNINDDMSSIVNKFDVKHLEISNIYAQNLMQIANEFDTANMDSQYGQKVSEIKDSYKSVAKIETFFKTEYSKYESEAYDIIKADDGIKLLAYNSKSVKETMENVVKDLNVKPSELQNLLVLEFSINNLYEIEALLVKLFKAIDITRKASVSANSHDDSYAWVNKLVDLSAKSQQYESIAEDFVERFIDFFKSKLMPSITSTNFLSELSNILPYNSIILFIKLVSIEDYEVIMEYCNNVLDNSYSKLIEDRLFEIKELLQPRRKTIVGNASTNMGQFHSDTASGISNTSSTVASSNISSSAAMLEFKNLDGLLKSWKEYVSTKKIDILLDYKESNVLIAVIKAMNFLEKLPLHYQNFLCVFFFLNSNRESSDLSLFLKNSPIPAKRIVSLATSMEDAYSFDTNILESRWELCSSIFSFKLSNFFVVVLNLLKIKNINLLNPIMLVFEKKIYDMVHLKNSNDYLFVQNSFESFMAKIKLEIEGFIESKITEFQRYKLSMPKDSLHSSISKLEFVVQNVTLFYFAVFQDIEFLAHNLSIDDQNKVVPVTHSLMNSSYETFCKILADQFLSVYELVKSNEKRLDVSSATLMETDEMKSGVGNMLTMNFLCGYCTDFLSLYNTSDVVTGYLSEVKRKQNDFFKPKLSEILIKENFFKLYVFVKSSWAIIDSNSNNNDPSTYIAYSGNNLNQILLDYDSGVISDIIEKMYDEIVKHTSILEKSLISQISDVNCQVDLKLVKEYMNLFVSKIWSSIQGDLVSFFLQLYSLIDKYYSKGPNKIETALKFNKNDVIQAFMRIKKENNLQ